MILTTLLLVCPALASPIEVSEKPARQFDFWIGEWSVQNLALAADGSWTEGDVTRARITPVCGDQAILEEWAGIYGGGHMNGFSLRAWNEALERWDLLLNWSVDGNGSFGLLTGNFRHGRGEFYAGRGGAAVTRYTFSDALSDTVRWDSSVSRDGEQTWRTDWVMEFTRTRAASEVTQDVLYQEDWNAGELRAVEQARALDPILGSWQGTHTLADGSEFEARLRSRLLNKDALVLDLLEWRAADSDDWQERLSIRSWIASAGHWETWRLSEADPVLRRARGQMEGEVLLSAWEDAQGRRHGEALVMSSGAELTIEETRIAADGTTELVATTELSRE